MQSLQAGLCKKSVRVLIAATRNGISWSLEAILNALLCGFTTLYCVLWILHAGEPARLVGFDPSPPKAIFQGKPQAIAHLRAKNPYTTLVVVGDDMADLQAVQVSNRVSWIANFYCQGYFGNAHFLCTDPNLLPSPYDIKSMTDA